MADRLQQFMATTCAEWGNEVSMAMYGYAKFTERNYFPIKSSDTKIRTNDQNSGGDTGLYSVLNYGMTKALSRTQIIPLTWEIFLALQDSTLRK